ncbi:ribonuclease HII [Heyndrickxia acidicola]|uniref:Ribonuclease HII n=1 Tax=Heyndrickxia acidicola TaxID=209389 RepID=A0ABU6MBN9_9BACI|nr:ribonuclease HII [Heyndrickxia acidicola]MED1202092.1 ribonuclease HII [Heyndrickxia acidicola]
MKNYTINEIHNYLNTTDTIEEPLMEKLAQDSRKGVQTLLRQWQSKQDRKLKLHGRFIQMLQYEKALMKQGYRSIAGIDEVGRGPLAGPVVAAAVVLPENFYLPGVNDSKKLSEKKRNEFYGRIMEEATAVGIGIISSEEIDRINIYQASKKAMITSLQSLSLEPDHLLIDAMELELPIAQTSLIKGDEKSVSIACASIVAKVTRDRLMSEYALEFPEYQFHQNMGYGTKDHLEALQKFGPSSIHRRSFAPVKELV